MNWLDELEPAARKVVLTRAHKHALYELYLRSDAWREQRSAAIRRAGGACEDCGRSFLVVLEVHHLTYANLGAELEGDLMALCHACHADRHPTAIAA